jgi:hypothetical protein
MQPAKSNLAQPFTLRERSCSYKAQWNSIGNLSTKITCNPIYIKWTIPELQIIMKFHRHHIHQYHLQSHLNCGNDPIITNYNGILSIAHSQNTGKTSSFENFQGPLLENLLIS